MVSGSAEKWWSGPSHGIVECEVFLQPRRTERHRKRPSDCAHGVIGIADPTVGENRCHGTKRPQVQIRIVGWILHCAMQQRDIVGSAR